MKKTLITCILFVAVITPLTIYAGLDIKIPRNEDRITFGTGGYMFFELNNGEFYLIDTRSGRLWQFTGGIANPEHFEPIKYEIAKDKLQTHPENDLTNQFPGRFAFEKVKHKLSTGFYILDTVTGKMWKLNDDSDSSLKITLVPRKE